MKILIFFTMLFITYIQACDSNIPSECRKCKHIIREQSRAEQFTRYKNFMIDSIAIPGITILALTPALYGKNRIMQGLPFEKEKMFNGAGWMCATAVPAATINIGGNNLCSSEDDSTPLRFTKSLGCGSLSGIMTNSLELLCQNMQNGYSLKHIKKQGLKRILLSGMPAISLREGLYVSGWSTLSPMFSQYLHNHFSNIYLCYFLSGICIGFPIGFITSPIDKIRAIQHAHIMTNKPIPPASTILSEMFYSKSLFQGGLTRGRICATATIAMPLMMHLRQKYIF